MLAWNDLAAALMEDFAALDARASATSRAGRSSGASTTIEPLYGISDTAEFRHHVVSELRATLARYPADPAVTELVDELRDGSAEFARLWERHDVQAAPMLTKTFRHPVVGEVTVDCDSLALTDRDQHLVLYSAPPGSPGRRRARVSGRPGRANFLTSQRPTVVPRMSISASRLSPDSAVVSTCEESPCQRCSSAPSARSRTRLNCSERRSTTRSPSTVSTGLGP